MKLFCRKTGQGPPLIILHGLYGSSDNWLTFSRMIEDYFEVFLIDQRNHGQSPHSNIHSFQAMRDDLLEFIETNSITDPIIMGHSMGGKTAMFFAVSFPDKLKSLIVLDISPRYYSADDDINVQHLSHRKIIDILYRFPLSEIQSREQAGKLLSGEIGSERIRQFLLKNLKRNTDGSFSWKLNIKALKNQTDELFKGLDKNELKPYNYPVLFVKGAQSSYISSADFDLIKDMFPGADIRTITGAGHWLQAEKPEELKSLILNFAMKYNIIH